jgi:hypothetical protein
VEGSTVDGGGGLRVGAGEEKVRDSVLVLRLTLSAHTRFSCIRIKLFTQSFWNIFVLQIVLGFWLTLGRKGPWRRDPLGPNGCRNCRRFAC